MSIASLFCWLVPYCPNPLDAAGMLSLGRSVCWRAQLLAVNQLLLHLSLLMQMCLPFVLHSESLLCFLVLRLQRNRCDWHLLGVGLFFAAMVVAAFGYAVNAGLESMLKWLSFPVFALSLLGSAGMDHCRCNVLPLVNSYLWWLDMVSLECSLFMMWWVKILLASDGGVRFESLHACVRETSVLDAGAGEIGVANLLVTQPMVLFLWLIFTVQRRYVATPANLPAEPPSSAGGSAFRSGDSRAPLLMLISLADLKLRGAVSGCCALRGQVIGGTALLLMISLVA
ncbi:hypothetical protein Nepgr_020378 [Nepenthes gracilis]|uniref:Uncharacterized protein n=1 Tax=Nepenthes gracilis TaxID=150966 RepID=A0AAD3XV09_NEPGR|nr:hypothetical protein Nepgr_020378 [Nepenthes gracilis]